MSWLASESRGPAAGVPCARARAARRVLRLALRAGALARARRTSRPRRREKNPTPRCSAGRSGSGIVVTGSPPAISLRSMAGLRRPSTAVGRPCPAPAMRGLALPRPRRAMPAELRRTWPGTVMIPRLPREQSPARPARRASQGQADHPRGGLDRTSSPRCRHTGVPSARPACPEKHRGPARGTNTRTADTDPEDRGDAERGFHPAPRAGRASPGAVSWLVSLLHEKK